MFAECLKRAVACTAIAIAVGLSGCSKSADDFTTKEGFADYLLSRCLRKESHFNPRPMYLHTLKGITGEPKSVADVDESTQKWQFDFDDGSMDVFVVLEPGASWVAEYPKVFVDVHRSGLLR